MSYSARKLRDQKLQESTQSISKNIPKKRTSRVVDDDSEDSFDEPIQSQVRSTSRHQVKEVHEDSNKNNKHQNQGGKRQKRDSNSKYTNSDTKNTDYSSPNKLPINKQSDYNEDDQPYLSSTAAGSTTKKATKKIESFQSPQKPEVQQSATITMDNYLNLENLKHLERISKQVKLDFNFFTKELIKEMRTDKEKEPIENISNKLRHIEGKAHLNIEGLQQSTQHIQKDKLSDKFSRREIQFFDLYIKKDNGEDLAQLKDNQFPLDIDAEQYYQEMEIDDFSNLFQDSCLVEERFGKTIKVKVTKNIESQRVTRQVKEYPELVKMKDNRRDSNELQTSQIKHAAEQKDPELLSIHASLKQFEKDYQKSHEEIAEIFCKVSGRLNKMKDYLENRPVIEWTYLEDLALSKPDDSAEFQVLLATKGWEEILTRRDFLHASPLMAEEEVKQQ